MTIEFRNASIFTRYSRSRSSSGHGTTSIGCVITPRDTARIMRQRRRTAVQAQRSARRIDEERIRVVLVSGQPGAAVA